MDVGRIRRGGEGVRNRRSVPSARSHLIPLTDIPSPLSHLLSVPPSFFADCHQIDEKIGRRKSIATTYWTRSRDVSSIAVFYTSDVWNNLSHKPRIIFASSLMWFNFYANMIQIYQSPFLHLSKHFDMFIAIQHGYNNVLVINNLREPHCGAACM